MVFMNCLGLISTEFFSNFIVKLLVRNIHMIKKFSSPQNFSQRLIRLWRKNAVRVPMMKSSRILDKVGTDLFSGFPAYRQAGFAVLIRAAPQ
jgi:hypothetical protein